MHHHHTHTIAQQLQQQHVKLLEPHIEYPIRHELKTTIQRYIQMHNDMIQHNIQPKFIILKPSGQLCNRIRAVIAAFTLALLTDRALIVPEFGYGETQYLDLFTDPGFNLTAKFIPKGKKQIIDMSESTSSVEKFACWNWLDQAEHSIWELRGSNYIITYLYANPYLKDKMNTLFVDGDIFRPILFYLFRPVDRIIQLKDEFRRKQNLNEQYTIGFHFRTEYPITDVEWKAYRECALSVTPKHVLNSTTWFASTDTLKARSTIRQNLREDVAFYSPDVFIVGAYKSGLEQAMVDILIASESDQLFLTPHSSFSRVIAMYAKSPLVYMVSDYGIPEQDPHRTFTKVGEHCYRYLKKEDCAWHGYRTSAQEQLERVSCYTPAMISDIC